MATVISKYGTGSNYQGGAVMLLPKLEIWYEETETLCSITVTVGIEVQIAAGFPLRTVGVISSIYDGSYNLLKNWNDTNEPVTYSNLERWTELTYYTRAYTTVVEKSHSSQTIAFSGDIMIKLQSANIPAENVSGTGVLSFNLPAKTSYAVTYNANDGSGAPSAQTKWYEEELTLSSSIPTRTGYAFSHWNTAADGSGTSYDPGDSYTTNAALTLYAIWEKKVEVSITSVYRCDGLGTPDEAGGSLVAEFSIVSDYAVTDSSLSITDGVVQHAVSAGTFPAGTINDAVQYDGYSSSTYIYPLSTYTITLSVTTEAGTVTTSTTLQPSTTYTRPTITNVAVKRVASTSSTTDDDLGRYLYATFDYSTFAPVQGNLPTVTCEFDDDTGGIQTLSPSTTSGTLSAYSSQFAYSYITPGVAKSNVFYVTVSDKFYSATATGNLSSGGYFLPRISGVEAARSGYDGVFDDAGITASVSFSWQVRQTGLQTAPQSIVLNAYDKFSTLVASKTITPSLASGTQTVVFQETDKTQDSPAPSGVVFEPDMVYTITAVLTDLYTSAFLSSQILTSFFTMDFLAGGHGIAMGKPSSRAGLDIAMQTYFEEPFMVAEQLSLPTYTFPSKPSGSSVPALPAHIDCEDETSWLAIENDEEPDGVEFISLGGGNVYKPPAGRIFPYAGTTAPEGYLMCDGSAYSRTDYAELFAAIGTTYGAGDGSTTFNVPDLRGRVPVGSSTSYSMGATGGEASVTLTSAQSGVPAHSHGGGTLKVKYDKANSSVTGGSHKHNLSDNGYAAAAFGAGNGWFHCDYIYKSASFNSTRRAGAASASYSGYANNTNLSEGEASGIALRGTTDDNTSHSHTLGYTSTDSTTASGSTGNNTAANASAAHNNMQPYQVVNYIISTGKTNIAAIKGEQGVSIVSATEQSSAADGGENIITLHLSDESTQTFSVHNGSKGSTGDAAGFGTPTASVDSNVGTPSVTVTASGPDTAKVFDFAFSNMKGEKGDKGDKGDAGDIGTVIYIGSTAPDLATTQYWIWINTTNGAMMMRNYVAPDAYTNGGWKWREIMFVDEGKNSETYAATTDTPSQ